jgi:hypothetical protein
MSLRQIGEAIGELSYPAVSDAVRRFNVRLNAALFTSYLHLISPHSGSLCRYEVGCRD